MIATRTLESDNLEIPAPTLPPKPGLIAGLIAELMKRVGAVGKHGQAQTGRNGGNSYAYRKIDDIYAAIQQHMAELGVLAYPVRTVREHEERATRGGEGVLTFTRMTVTYRWQAAADASYVDQEVCGEGMDSSDKSTNKATSAAEKYAIVTMLKLPTELIDSESANPQPAARQQQPRGNPGASRCIQGNPGASGGTRAPGPAPAVQRPAFDQIVRARLEDRGLRGGDVETAVREIAASYEVADLNTLGQQERARVLNGIARGGADRWRSAAQAV